MCAPSPPPNSRPCWATHPARWSRTAEHVLAALRGLGVDNAIVELDGPEAPIMDGSAAPFVAAIDQVGIVTLDAPRRYLQVLKPVRVAQKDGSYGELRPYAKRFPRSRSRSISTIR